MTWHETIDYIHTQPEFSDLIIKAYFDKDLVANVNRFGNSEEFRETMHLIKSKQIGKLAILDVGAGNGIATINFAKEGYNVTALEPDKSKTVGSGAIKILAKRMNLDNVSVIECYAEEISLPDCSFDVVYVRQAMHHANNLKTFLKELARLIKPGGMLLTVRDHVIYDEIDKQLFLNTHPLQKFYGGENAFTANEYKVAIREAGLSLQQELKFFDSVINYFPILKSDITKMYMEEKQKMRQLLKRKISVFAYFPPLFALYLIKNGKFKKKNLLNEEIFPGRMYSYLAIKK
jgi:ubiquinone/menaquinone biosynthesis C-methylase UbiE